MSVTSEGWKDDGWVNGAYDSLQNYCSRSHLKNMVTSRNLNKMFKQEFSYSEAWFIHCLRTAFLPELWLSNVLTTAFKLRYSGELISQK